MYKFLEILAILVVITTFSMPVWAIEYAECRGVTEPDTFVASKRSCAKYIFCDGENSFEGECLGGNYFNVAEGICDDRENVPCDIVESDNVVSIYDDNFNKAPQSSGGPNSEGKTDNEGGQKEEVETGGSVVLVDAIEASAENTEEDVEDLPDNVIKVPEAPKCPQGYGQRSIRHIPHSESCSAFYTCYNGMAIPMLCPRKLYFNAATEKCEQQMPEICKLPYSLRLNCRKGVNDYMPHSQRCEYYYYCLDGFLMIMRCPYNFTWHFERRTCVHKSQSKCYVESAILTQQPVIYRYNSA